MSIHTLRKRFVKDAGLPIQVMQSPHFEYFLSLYDPLFGCISKYEDFLTEVELIGGEDAYFKYVHRLIGTIVNHISEKSSYQSFNDGKNQLNQYHTNFKISKENIYNPDNNGKRFISVDLKKANFNALRYHDPSIFDNLDTYEEWISQFTSYKTIKSSKHVRQVIFGNLNPTRQIKVQKYLISEIIELLVAYFEDKGLSKEESIAKMKSASSDEIVIEVTQQDDAKAITNYLEEQMKCKQITIKIAQFTLENLADLGVDGYVKEDTNGEIEFKTIPDMMMAEAFKVYHGEEIKEEDLIFYHEGRLAKFLI